MDRNEDIEALKRDLRIKIDGMEPFEYLLKPDRRETLSIFRRCLSVLERIKPCEEVKA